MDNIKFRAKIIDESHLSAGKIVDVEWIDFKTNRLHSMVWHLKWVLAN